MQTSVEYLRWLVTSSAFIGWLTIGAELLVAGVIYFEIEHERQKNFFERSRNHDIDLARREIYEAFINMPGDYPDPGARSVAFLKTVICEKPDMRSKCDLHIVLVNELGFTATRKFSRNKALIEMFAQGPIFVWVILQAYILQRREDTGRWFASHMLVYTLKCLDFVLKEEHAIFLRLPDGSAAIKITEEYMRRVRSDLKTLVKAARKRGRPSKQGPVLSRPRLTANR